MAKKKTAAAEENPPNVIFVGRQNRYNPEKGKYESVPRPAPAFVIDGETKIVLPEGIEKGAFVAEDVKAQLIALFPQDFKPMVSK